MAPRQDLSTSNGNEIPHNILSQVNLEDWVPGRVGGAISTLLVKVELKQIDRWPQGKQYPLKPER